MDHALSLCSPPSLTQDMDDNAEDSAFILHDRHKLPQTQWLRTNIHYPTVFMSPWAGSFTITGLGTVVSSKNQGTSSKLTHCCQNQVLEARGLRSSTPRGQPFHSIVYNMATPKASRRVSCSPLKGKILTFRYFVAYCSPRVSFSNRHCCLLYLTKSLTCPGSYSE